VVFGCTMPGLPLPYSTGDALRRVRRLIDVAAAADGDVVREAAECGTTISTGAEERVGLGHGDQVVLRRIRGAA
jgi:hypothetical protein